MGKKKDTLEYLKIPNKETKRVMEETDKGENLVYSDNVKDFFKKLHSVDIVTLNDDCYDFICLYCNKELVKDQLFCGDMCQTCYLDGLYA